MNNGLIKLAKNKNIVVLNTEALSCKECEEFLKFFPERAFSFGLAEANMISAAAGFALAGKLPIVIGNAQFLIERAFEQIKNDLFIPNLNVKLVGIGKNEFAKKLLGTLNGIEMREGFIDDLEEMALKYGPAYLEIPA